VENTFFFFFYFVNTRERDVFFDGKNIWPLNKSCHFLLHNFVLVLKSCGLYSWRVKQEQTKAAYTPGQSTVILSLSQLTCPQAPVNLPVAIHHSLNERWAVL